MSPPPRLVVTLATIPSRISHIRPVLDSIRRQTRRPDAVYVCISEYCARERAGYEVPDWLTDDPDVEVAVSRVDYGPATKLLGVLPHEPAPETRIVVVDDDWRYPPTLVEQLEERFEREPRRAVGLSGARIPRQWSRFTVRIGDEIQAKPAMPGEMVFIAEPPEDAAVDILQGGPGCLLKRGWFDDDIYELVHPGEPLFFSDDVLFAAYLEHKGIDRVCVSGIPMPEPLAHSTLGSLSGDGRMTANYAAAIPAISAALDIWAPEERFVHPSPAFGVRLRHQALRIGRGTRRLARGFWAVVTPGFAKRPH